MRAQYNLANVIIPCPQRFAIFWCALVSIDSVSSDVSFKDAAGPVGWCGRRLKA